PAAHVRPPAHQRRAGGTVTGLPVTAVRGIPRVRPCGTPAVAANTPGCPEGRGFAPLVANCTVGQPPPCPGRASASPWRPAAARGSPCPSSRPRRRHGAAGGPRGPAGGRVLGGVYLVSLCPLPPVWDTVTEALHRRSRQARPARPSARQAATMSQATP